MKRCISGLIAAAVLLVATPVLLFSGMLSGSPARVYRSDEGAVVYEPKGYDPTLHSPSPIFLAELPDLGAPEHEGTLEPVFKTVWGKSTAVIKTSDADLYGAGEVMAGLRRNDEKIYLWNTENPTGMLNEGRRMYQSHPWVLGVRKDGSAFGIIADNTWKSVLTTKKGSVAFSSDGPAFRIVIIEKDNPREVLKALAQLSGKIEMPPLWALGYQQCRYSYYPQSRVEGLADTLRNHRIPCDVIWMDIHYMDSYKIFTFDPVYFPDPKGLNDYLHSRDFHSVYMIDPGVKDEKGYFVDDQGREGDYFVRNKKGELYHGRVWPGECHFPDFTREDVCRWWSGLYADLVSKGVDGVWNDMNEPSVFVDFGGTMPKTNIHKGGKEWPEGPHLRYHNIYGYLMVRATLEGIRAANPDKRPFVLSRSNFLGGQRYAAMWTGDNFSDWSQMKIAVPMCLNMGLSAQPFNGPDIGGFLRDCTPELLRHWTASGVYFPFVRNHASLGTANQEPWAFDEDTEDICRRAIERRYRLLPYFYTLFEEASRTGLPVMRPVFWSDFTDTSLRDEQQAFLVGDDLLVIPRWSQSPALPKGDWDIFPMEDEDDGYQSYLALRSGAALPLAQLAQSTATYSLDSLSVLVNPSADGRACGDLYVDSGEGYGYKSGEYVRYALEATTDLDGVVTLNLRRKDGNMAGGIGWLRIGVVSDGAVAWSQWKEGDSVSVAGLPDRKGDLSLEGLDFVYLEDGALAKKMTKTELILTNIVK